MPAGALLEVLVGDRAAGNWQAIARLDGVAAGEAVRIALTDAQSAARTGSTFIVDAVGNGTTWAISPATRNVAEGDVTISFTITRSGANLGAETVYVSTTQTQGFYNDGDYVGRLNVPVVFAAGDTSENFTVRINADAVPEGNETFGVIVQADPNDPLSVRHAIASFTIQDGAPPTASGSNYTGDGLDNVWSGTSSNDVAFGMAGNDSLTGAGGDDILAGVDGDDSLYGGSGNDVILAGSGANYVDAGSENDVIDAREVGYASNSQIYAGTGNDLVLVGSGWSGIGTTTFTDGGTGNDTLVVEARSAGGGSQWAGLVHRFGADGTSLLATSGFELIEAAIAAGGLHHVSTSAWTFIGYPRPPAEWSYMWIANTGFENIDYRGIGGDDLFLSFGNNMHSAIGGIGTDALYADWSTTTAAIVWNVTVNNDDQRTLGNGVVVQSIERLMLKTGSGNDNLVMGDQSDHVETGAGNDRIVTGDGADYVDAGSGNDVIDSRKQNNAASGQILAGTGDDVVLVGAAWSGYSTVLTVDGGGGTDTLTIEARSTGGNSQYAGLVHRFGADGTSLLADSGFELIEAAIAAGGLHHVSTSAWTFIGYPRPPAEWSYTWVTNVGFENIEYLGISWNDLFLSWGDNMRSAIGGEGADALYADWSTTTAAIVWNVTVNNDDQRTLGNGVVVQSIERLMLKTGSGNDNLVMGDQSDHVETGAGNDRIVTGDGADYVDAGSGNDIVDVGAGNDTLTGGDGLDIGVLQGIRSGYSLITVNGITTVTDINLADGDSGTDVFTSVETLRFSDQDLVVIQPVTVTVNLTSSADIYLTTTLDNYVVSGLAGNDSITTNSGSDTITGGTGNDTIVGGAGNDRILFGIGSNGFDAVDGGSDSDDRIMATAASVTIGLAFLAGIEAVDAAGFANVKILSGSTSDSFDFSFVALTGITQIDLASGNDTVFGSAGDDTIIGGSGSDSLNGGAGNDTFSYTGTGSGYDFIDGGSGASDRIVVTANASIIRLEALSGIELIDASGFSGVRILASSAANNFDLSATTLTGITAIDLGSGNDTLIGSGGNDTIIAGRGNDSVSGGNGDDVFRVGTSAGTDIYNGGIGNDRLEASANNVSLTVTGANLIEIETISAGAFTGLTLLGTSAANTLDFSGMTLTGVTRISGESGNDTITGSSGNDLIEGGSGRDILTGGFGEDVFDFNLTSHSRTTNVDRVTDFALGEDTIDLATIDADGALGVFDAFLFVGASAFSGVAGELRYDITSLSGVTRVFADLDGNRSMDMEIQLTGTHLLTASEFML